MTTSRLIRFSANLLHHLKPPAYGNILGVILPHVEVECDGEVFEASLFLRQPENLTWVVLGDGTDYVEYEGEMVMHRWDE